MDNKIIIRTASAADAPALLKIEFHTHMGYRLVGEFHKCGYKFNHWYNMVWMEKLIGEHLTVQEPPKFPLL